MYNAETPSLTYPLNRRCVEKQIQPTHKKANISTKNALYFELGTEWNAEKAEKTPIFAKKSAHNEQL